MYSIVLAIGLPHWHEQFVICTRFVHDHCQCPCIHLTVAGETTAPHPHRATQPHSSLCSTLASCAKHGVVVSGWRVSIWGRTAAGSDATFIACELMSRPHK